MKFHRKLAKILTTQHLLNTASQLGSEIKSIFLVCENNPCGLIIFVTINCNDLRNYIVSIRFIPS